MTLRITVLAGAAIGICSALYFLSLVIGAGALAPLVVSALGCVALVRWARLPASTVPWKAPTRWLLAAFSLALAAAIASVVLLGLKEPHGNWDAWAIWNLHARFLEHGGAGWTALFARPLGWSHPDYPLLLPAFIAQIWAVIRSETTVVPMAVAFLFTFGTVAVLMGAVRELRGWDQALIAGAFLLACTDFLIQGAAQYADIPLSFYAVSSLALLCLDDARSAVLAGAMAAFAAWTKNEGLLFIVVLAAARLFARLRLAKTEGMARELGFFAAGAAPILAVLAFFKIRYAPADQLLFSHRWSDILSRAIDFGRYVTIITAFVKTLFQLGEVLVPAILVLAAYAWLVRFKIPPEYRLSVTTAVAAVVLMLAGDFAVYLLLPNDLIWQINTSMDRIFTQILPAGLLAFFWATSTVELAAPPPEPKKQHAKKAATRHP